jgi:hypothetical protein
MSLYAGLFESMMACCGRAGLRRGPLYTLTMVALGLAVSLNLLSVVQLLWTLGVLDNPYRLDGDLHSQRYVLGTLYLAFLVNMILARRKFSADQQRVACLPVPRRIAIRAARLAARDAAAPVYVLGSAGVFILTLSMRGGLA